MTNITYWFPMLYNIEIKMKANEEDSTDLVTNIAI